MSYDIYLKEPVSEKVVEFEEPHHIRGGTYQMGGCKEAWLNVTYNYAKHYYRVFAEAANLDRGIRSIYGMSGAESIPVLRKAASLLGDEISEDYWEPTEGNAKKALLQLVALATLRPDGVWDGD